MTDHTVALLPCPFCGDAKPFVGKFSAGFYVECMQEKCQMSGVPFDTAEKAIEAWNRRAQPQQPAGEQAGGPEDGDITYEIWQDDMIVATSTDPKDASHYAAVYSQDGPVKVYTVLRADWEGTSGGVVKAPAHPSQQEDDVRDTARLDAFRPGWELSYCWDGDDDVYWAVHRVTGSPNDREWTLIGRGDTPRNAIDAAMTTAQGGSKGE